PALQARLGERAVRVAVRSGREPVEGRDVRRERIQLRAQSRLRRPQGIRRLRELRVREEAGAAGEVTDVGLEVLDLVEVRRPVYPAVGHSALADEAGGVAEALAHLREVPHLLVAVAVQVATRA